MSVHNWNTRMPDTGEVALMARELAEYGLDVHTATIILDNGGFVVHFDYTDEDMQDGRKTHRLSSNGGLS